MYFKIGDVAEMYDTSIRALRLYDKMDLFKPEYTDEHTGYRYYTADQLPLLNTILVFKAIGIKLFNIKLLIDKGIQPKELIRIMAEKRDYWEKQIAIAEYNIENIDKIVAAASEKLHETENGVKSASEAEADSSYKMSRLVCLENIKVESLLSEVLWL